MILSQHYTIPKWQCKFAGLRQPSPIAADDPRPSCGQVRPRRTRNLCRLRIQDSVASQTQ